MSGPMPVPPPQPSFGQRVARFIGHLLRLVLWTLFLVAVLAGLAMLIGWGIPYVDRTIVQPLQDARARLAHLEDAHTTLAQQVAANEAQMADLADRLDALQAQQQELADQLQALAAQTDTLTGQSSAYQARLADLEDRIAALQDSLADLEARQAALEALGADLTALQRQWTLQRALLHVSQARLALVQEDWRLAQEEMDRAAAALGDLATRLGDPIALEALDEAQTRLRLARGKALTAPDIAARDLDVVWTLLNQAFPPPGPLPTTAAPEATTPEPILSPTPTFTPTPTPTSP